MLSTQRASTVLENAAVRLTVFRSTASVAQAHRKNDSDTSEDVRRPDLVEVRSLSESTTVAAV